MLKNTCLDPIYKIHKQDTLQNQNHKGKKKKRHAGGPVN